MPNQVTPAEAATLIGMLKATSTYNPRVYPQRAIERRNVVLGQMVKYNYLSKADYDKYTQFPIGLDGHYVDKTGQGDSYIRHAVEKWLDKWCKENNYDLYEDGLKIYTTIDSRLQQYAEEAVADKMKMLQNASIIYGAIKTHGATAKA
jgi:penicillin-binding protein 1A